MKIKLQDIKKINAFTLLVIGFTIGVVAMYFYYQPKFLSQEQTTIELANKPTPTPIPPFQYDVSKAINSGYSYYDVTKYLEGYSASHSAIKLINVPDVAPTPIVEYRTQTQYVETPAQDTSSQNSHTVCNSDLIGGQNCTTYHSGGNPTFTHCTSNLIGGMNCN